jgi:hypothetical protein
MSSCAVLHQRQDQAQRGHRKPRRQRPRAALPVSSCLKHGAHRWRSLNKFVLHLNLRHPVFPKLFSGNDNYSKNSTGRRSSLCRSSLMSSPNGACAGLASIITSMSRAISTAFPIASRAPTWDSVTFRRTPPPCARMAVISATRIQLPQYRESCSAIAYPYHPLARGNGGVPLPC